MKNVALLSAPVWFSVPAGLVDLKRLPSRSSDVTTTTSYRPRASSAKQPPPLGHYLLPAAADNPIAAATVLLGRGGAPPQLGQPAHLSNANGGGGRPPGALDCVSLVVPVWNFPSAG